MTECITAILTPVWIGIFFNLALTAFNIAGMALCLQGRFVDWYLEKNGYLKIMFVVWVAIAIAAAASGLSCGN